MNAEPDDRSGPVAAVAGETGRGRSAGLGGAAALFVASILATVALAAGAPAADGAVAVIYPPGFGAGRAVSAVVAARGRLLRFGRAAWVVVAMPAPGAGAGFAARLRAGGALAVVNPVVAGDCAAPSPA